MASYCYRCNKRVTDDSSVRLELALSSHTFSSTKIDWFNPVHIRNDRLLCKDCYAVIRQNIDTKLEQAIDSLTQK